MQAKHRVLLGCALAGSLSLTPGFAHAEVEPGGWKPDNPTFQVQQRGCGQVSDLTFKLTCSSSDGDNRAERRYATYQGGSHQFEGYFTITSMGGNRISLKQTFRDSPDDGPFFMLGVEKGGRLYSVRNGGDTIARGATVGTRVRVNTVHKVGDKHRTYINGSLKHTESSRNGSYYDKLGAYATKKGKGPITVGWSDIKFWRK
ncbi:hypothetical protein ACFWY6_41500 [Streptomyces sp. NPDC059037]|uniref:hypothetical protein n=1 Tax=Streptomyces sp. NPDC059037 TaxID=3346710 RepID=UPI0036ABA999